MKTLLMVAVLVLSSGYASAQNLILKTMVDRSDLIVLAEFPSESDFDVSLRGGPIPNPAFAQNSHEQYTPKIHIVSVLKGQVETKDDFHIGLILALSDKNPNPHPFKPQKNQRFLLFLEDMAKRSPESVWRTGGESIRFRNFDYYFSVFPENQAVIIAIEDMNRLKVESSHPVR